MMLALRRLGPVSALGAGVLLLTGCEGDGAFGPLASATGSTRPYQVLSLSEDRALVAAQGRRVAIEPAEGFCLANDSVEASRRSVFALIGDCALRTEPGTAPRSARGELKLPRGVPGIITVSVSGDPRLADSGGLDGLEAFLEGPEGRQLLGRGSGNGAVKVVETRQISGGIYVLVEDDSDDVLPVLSKRFWRGFTAVNDRLAVVTVSGFRARPLGNEQMLKYLVNQMQTLAVANSRPLGDEEIQLAAVTQRTGPEEGVERRVERGAVSLTDLEPEPLTPAISVPAAPARWPAPNRRPNDVVEAEAAVESSAEADVAAEKPASTDLAAAPLPPVRRGAAAETAPSQPEASAVIEDVAETEKPAPAVEASTAADNTGTRFAPKKSPGAPRRPNRA